MFKIMILNADAPDALEKLQDDYDVLSVQPLGFDSQNKYLLVQLATKTTPKSPPSPPSSGSVNAAK